MKTRIHDRYQRWLNDTYARFAPLIVIFCLLISTCAAVGVLWLTKVQGDEQEKRADGFRGLQQCFDTYATKSSLTSQAVRDASADVSVATTQRDVALNAVFRYIATEPAEDDPVGVRLFAALLDSNTELVRTQAELAKVRRLNPVPDPPSTFCEVRP